MHCRAVLLLVAIVLLSACVAVLTESTVLPTRVEAALLELTPSPTAIEAVPTAEPTPVVPPSDRFGYAEGESPVLGTPAPVLLPTVITVPPHFVFDDFQREIRLQIPVIGVDSPLGVTRPVSGTERLDYTGLDDYPLWISPSSSEIGCSGISLVIGHRQWGPKPKVFAHLDKLEDGDEVVVAGADLVLTYRVFATEEFEPDEVWPAIRSLEGSFEAEERSILVLYTCTPYGTDLRRLLVYAELAAREGN